MKYGKKSMRRPMVFLWNTPVVSVDENGHPINAIMQACDEQEYALKKQE